MTISRIFKTNTPKIYDTTEFIKNLALYITKGLKVVQACYCHYCYFLLIIILLQLFKYPKSFNFSSRLQELLQQFGYIEKGKGQWQNEVTVQKTEGQVSDITERDIEELEEQNTEHIREQKDIT